MLLLSLSLSPAGLRALRPAPAARARQAQRLGAQPGAHALAREPPAARTRRYGGAAPRRRGLRGPAAQQREQRARAAGARARLPGARGPSLVDAEHPPSRRAMTIARWQRTDLENTIFWMNFDGLFGHFEDRTSPFCPVWIQSQTDKMDPCNCYDPQNVQKAPQMSRKSYIDRPSGSPSRHVAA